jgi:N,N'-diacetyllegionaminate synthase
MVKAIRNIEKALGSSEKKPSPSETPNIEVARKSIVAASEIKKGERFSEHNLTTKRPAIGKSPMLWDSIVGTYAQKAYQRDEPI